MTERIFSVGDDFQLPARVYDALQDRQAPVIDGRVRDAVSGDTPTRDALDARYVRRGDRYIDARDHGVTGDGVTDDTAALQALINQVRDDVRANYGALNVIHLPGGRYKITDTIVQPPYVKIASGGHVVIESRVPNGPAWHVTPLADDPANLYAELNKQQWLRGALFDGAAGGIVFLNFGGQASGTVGLELGSRSDLGMQRPLSRYALNDIAIQGYDLAVQWNTYNHYIAHYRRLHLEGNTDTVQIGTSVDVNTYNSGENVAFEDCVFAATLDAFRWLSDSIDVTFRSCSFDYVRTAFRFRRGWLNVLVTGGHFETINEGIRRDDTSGGLAVSELARSGDKLPEVTIVGNVPYVYGEPGTQFRGPMQLRAELSMRSFGSYIETAPLKAAEAWLCDDAVIVRHIAYRVRTAAPFVSSKLNLVREPGFVKGAETTDPQALVDWSATASPGAQTQIVSGGPRGLNALRLAAAPNAWATMTYMPRIPVRPGEALLVGAAYKRDAVASNPRVNARVNWYDADGEIISSTPETNLHVAHASAGEWQVPVRPFEFIAPPGTATATVQWAISTPGGGSGYVYLSDVQAFVA